MRNGIFEFFFGSKSTQEIAAEKTAKMISEKISAEELKRDIVERVSKEMNGSVNAENINQESERIEIKKKELEIQLLKTDIAKIADIEKRNKDQPLGSIPKLFYLSNMFSKSNNIGLNPFLLNHVESSSPQAIQGKWQAYGQMHAARTRMWGSVLASGVFGLGLFFYQGYLSKQKKEIADRESAMQLASSSSYSREIIYYGVNKAMQSQLKVAEEKLKKAYGDDNASYVQYEVEGKAAFDDALVKAIEDKKSKLDTINSNNRIYQP